MVQLQRHTKLSTEPGRESEDRKAHYFFKALGREAISIIVVSIVTVGRFYADTVTPQGLKGRSPPTRSKHPETFLPVRYPKHEKTYAAAHHKKFTPSFPSDSSAPRSKGQTMPGSRESGARKRIATYTRGAERGLHGRGIYPGSSPNRQIPGKT